MQLTVQEVYEDWRTSERTVKETHIVEGKDLAECFDKAYPYERSLRYCNDWHIQFNDGDENIYKQYLEWKKVGVDILKYYGGGVVD